MITITEFPSQAKTSEPFILKGTATDVDDGDELLIVVDKRYEVARPRVQGGKWETSLIFNQAGDRLIEVMASDQDKAEVTLKLNPGVVTIISRSTWGAKPPNNSLAGLPNPKRITIHHTVMTALSSSANTTEEEERMLEIQRIHQEDSGFSDIGYHYVIMPSGRIYEGRPNSKKGAHDQLNDGFGIAFDGSYEQAGSEITDDQFKSAITLCTQLCKKIGISDPTTLVATSVDRDGVNSKNLPRILGHRDRIRTDCPGMNEGTSVRLEEIRQAVKANLP